MSNGILSIVFNDWKKTNSIYTTGHSHKNETQLSIINSMNKYYFSYIQSSQGYAPIGLFKALSSAKKASMIMARAIGYNAGALYELQAIKKGTHYYRVIFAQKVIADIFLVKIETTQAYTEGEEIESHLVITQGPPLFVFGPITQIQLDKAHSWTTVTIVFDHMMSAAD
jgi:hypothetical protein